MKNHYPPNAICINCNISFRTNPAYIKRGGGKYCSVNCMREFKINNPSTYIDNGGYLVCRRKRIHRQIMENYIGRKLLKKEHVHHINGIKTDNRIENLIILSESEHHKLHPTIGLNLKKKCISCGKEYTTIKSDYNNRSFCSLKCYWKMKKGTHLTKFNFLTPSV